MYKFMRRQVYKLAFKALQKEERERLIQLELDPCSLISKNRL